jgi:hypothetical protein
MLSDQSTLTSVSPLLPDQSSWLVIGVLLARLETLMRVPEIGRVVATNYAIELDLSCGIAVTEYVSSLSISLDLLNWMPASRTPL